MSSPFSQTTRSLEADLRGAERHWLVVLLLLAAAGAWWATQTEVSMWESTAAASVEAASGPVRVQAPLAGALALASLEIGRQVEAGEVLAVLEVEDQELALKGARASVAAARAQVEAVDAEIEALGEMLAGGNEEARSRTRVVQLQLERADLAASFAEREVERLQSLKASGAVRPAELDEKESLAAQAEARRDELARQLSGTRSQAVATDADLRARRERSRRDRAELAGQLHALEADIASLEHQLDRRTIRAPIAGRIGEARPLHVGNVVEAGEALATIIPDTDLEIVAFFEPSQVIGRVGGGEEARVELEGFPWPEYPVLRAKVSEIAGQPDREGRIRVELLPLDPPAALPLQHGQPARVELRVGSQSPFQMLLRSVGMALRSNEEAP